MKTKIGITDDLADIFIIQALKEGNCDYYTLKTQEKRNAHAEYMIRRNKFDKVTYEEKFDRLSQLMIMYDEIELPILNQYYMLNGKIEQIAKIRSDFPPQFYSEEQLSQEELSDNDAMKLKPFIMSAVNNINFSDGYIQYAIERKGSVMNLYSTVYDMMYNHDSGVSDSQLKKEALTGYCILAEHQQPTLDSPEHYILYTHKVIIRLVKSIMIYFASNRICESDYYSRIFTNFSTETNINDAYGMVKTQVSYIMEQQPAFEGLSEIIDFRKKKKRQIHDLREEVSSLEALLKEGAHERALQKAIADVRLANEALIKNSLAKRTAQIATYISVPISMVELLTFGTSFSMTIGVVGTIGQLSADLNSKQSDWLFVAR